MLPLASFETRVAVAYASGLMRILVRWCVRRASMCVCGRVTVISFGASTDSRDIVRETKCVRFLTTVHVVYGGEPGNE